MDAGRYIVTQGADWPRVSRQSVSCCFAPKTKIDTVPPHVRSELQEMLFPRGYPNFTSFVGHCYLNRNVRLVINPVLLRRILLHLERHLS
jgi:hypothetical protein